MKKYLFISALALSCSTRQAPPTVTDKGVRIDYTDTGSDDTALVFVHGWGLNKSYWSNQVAFFKDHYRIITLDLPGFGNSGKNRTIWDTRAFGDDIDSVLTQLHVKKAILVGHSMAGDMVLQAALGEPDRVIGLVGVDNFKEVGHTMTAQDTAAETTAYAGLRSHFKDYASAYFNQYLFYKTTPDSIRKRILNDMTHTDSVVAVECMEQGNLDEASALENVRMPLCLINSDYMPTDTTGLIAHRIPYHLWYIHATGHFPMVEDPGAFDTALAQAITLIRL